MILILDNQITGCCFISYTRVRSLNHTRTVYQYIIYIIQELVYDFLKEFKISLQMARHMKKSFKKISFNNRTVYICAYPIGSLLSKQSTTLFDIAWLL